MNHFLRVHKSFLGFCQLRQHFSSLLHVPPLRFHRLVGCWDWTRDLCGSFHWQPRLLTLQLHFVSNGRLHSISLEYISAIRLHLIYLARTHHPSGLHCKKRFAVFPSPAGISLTELSLSGNILIIYNTRTGSVWLVTSVIRLNIIHLGYISFIRLHIIYLARHSSTRPYLSYYATCHTPRLYISST